MISIEIKARCSDPARIRKILKARKARFKGLDHQIDTYFRIPSGRLKLREGNIEKALIYYRRTDRKNSKRCDSILCECGESVPLKKVLTGSLGVLVVVDKKREIYFIRNAKFHMDRVKKLGNFVEIEVFGKKEANLRKQCDFYQKLLGIKSKDLLADSYSDQLVRLQTRDRRLQSKKIKGFCCRLSSEVSQAKSLSLTGRRFDPQVPGLFSKTPAQTVPQNLQAPFSLKSHFLISNPLLAISSFPQE